VPLPTSTATRLLLVCVLVLCAGWGTAHAQPAEPSREEVKAAADKLRADPNLGGTRKEKTLRFKETDEEPDEDEPDPDPASDGESLGWLADFAGWMASAGRVFVWVVGAVAVVMLLVGMRHWIRVRAESALARPKNLPSHVRDLDIRPESLPDQVGAAAAALWQRGEHRAALSLLYRGALSRLVHDHAVPIRAASTEGECVRLAASRLSPERGAFFERLVAAWQLAVYGDRMPETANVLALCSEFDASLGAAKPVVEPAP
jgi:hypothetical protein